MTDGWVDAEVQQQGSSLVIMDKSSGDCLVVELSYLFRGHMGIDPHDWEAQTSRLESIFGAEVLEGAVV